LKIADADVIAEIEIGFRDDDARGALGNGLSRLADLLDRTQSENQ
jgi:hypothetical protein